MNQRYSERLQAFFDYWQAKVRKGENSDIGRIECMTLEIYDDWLRDYEKYQNEVKLYREGKLAGEPAFEKPE
jgi:hypothetical protein